MRKIFCLEFRHSRNALFWLLSLVIVLAELRLIFLDYSEYSGNETYMMFTAFMFIIPVFILLSIISGKTLSDEHKKHYSIYFLILPVKRWKTWAAKIIYCFTIFLAFLILPIIMPDPLNLVINGLRKIFFVILPYYIVLYILVGIILLLSISSIPERKFYQIKNISKKEVLILLPMTALIVICLLKLGEDRISRFRLIAISIIAGISIFAIYEIAIEYCRSKYHEKATIKKVLILLISCISIFILQFIYSYFNLFSSRIIERQSAFKMLLYIDNSIALRGFRNTVNNSEYIRGGAYEMARFFADDERIFSQLNDVWEKAIDNDECFLLDSSMEFMSRQGTNENLFNKVVEKYKNDAFFRKNMPTNTFAIQLIFLAPQNEIEQTCMQFIQSSIRLIRMTGYSMAAFFPNNSYVMPIIHNAKNYLQTGEGDQAKGYEEKQAFNEICMIIFTLDTITLNNKYHRCNELKNINTIISNYDEWYSINGHAKYAERIRMLLRDKGYPDNISNMTNEEIRNIYDAEYGSKDENEALLDYLENILSYREKRLRYSSYKNRIID